MTEARLVPTAEKDNPFRKEVLLQVGRTTLGRSPRNDVALNDPEVSKLHAEIVLDEEGCTVADLGSSNGTYVNGDPVEKHRFQSGDLVEIGSCCFRFEARKKKLRKSNVVLVPPGPVERTQVLAAEEIAAMLPGREISDLEQLRRRYDRVRAAFEAVGTLIDTTDIALLCQRILDVAFQLVKAETGAVLLFDEQEKLVPWATRGKEEGEDPDIVISQTIVDQVVKEKSAVLASDALTDSRWSGSESVVLSGLRSLMCVPLLNADNVYGLLHVGNATQVAAFGKADLELITGIGTGAGVALSNAFLAHRLAEEARTRESLGRFLSPVLVEQVMQNAIEIQRGGEELDVTLMFADIRGFTSLTERSEAADIVSLLNEYFDRMVDVVFEHDGALDKYIGDALMAIWGSPVNKPEDASEAVAAAREMQLELRQLNQVRQQRGEEAIAVGIGLATGRCVCGAIGAKKRMEYTVIGDAVNLASRLSGVAGAGEVICDEATFIAAGKPDGGKSLPPAKVKGKAQPVAVYRLHSEESDAG